MSGRAMGRMMIWLVMNGLECHLMKPNSFSKVDFHVFMILVALRGGHLKPGDYVIIDNARIHLGQKYNDPPEVSCFAETVSTTAFID